jgi:hypothetical protein
MFDACSGGVWCLVRCCEVGKRRQKLVVMKEINRIALEEEAPAFILFPDQVAHPITDPILNKRNSH